MQSTHVQIRSPDLLRLVTALIADELGRSRGRAVDVAEWAAWTPQTRIDEDGVGADSLARLDIVGRVNEFFHLHEVGSEDYLVVRRSIGEWVEIVRQSLAIKSERITFRTGGSTGDPKPVTHETAHLAREIEAIAALAPNTRRVLSLVPPHHIYGFLWTVLLPAKLGVEAIDLRAAAASAAKRMAQADDLIVATPFLWAHVLKAGVPSAPGVASGAPMPTDLWRSIEAAGLPRLIEIYGSSETAGIGWREAPDAPFTLLPHWLRDGDALVSGGVSYEPPDHLAWDGERRLRPQGRRDGAVQVGGVNVYPARVRDLLLTHEAVADCAVRLDPSAGRLKAFVVPRRALAEADLEAFIRAKLPAPERPARWRLGPALPRDAMGKLSDWE